MLRLYSTRIQMKVWLKSVLLRLQYSIFRGLFFIGAPRTLIHNNFPRLHRRLLESRVANFENRIAWQILACSRHGIAASPLSKRS